MIQASVCYGIFYNGKSSLIAIALNSVLAGAFGLSALPFAQMQSPQNNMPKAFRYVTTTLTHFVFWSTRETLMGCTDPFKEGVGSTTIRVSLGSTASYLVHEFFYADVRFRIPMTYNDNTMTHNDNRYAVLSEVVQSFFGEFTMVPLLVMATEACPAGSTGSTYATFLSLLNLGDVVSGLITAPIVKAFGITYVCAIFFFPLLLVVFVVFLGWGFFWTILLLLLSVVAG